MSGQIMETIKHFRDMQYQVNPMYGSQENGLKVFLPGHVLKV